MKFYYHTLKTFKSNIYAVYILMRNFSFQDNIVLKVLKNMFTYCSSGPTSYPFKNTTLSIT